MLCAHAQFIDTAAVQTHTCASANSSNDITTKLKHNNTLQCNAYAQQFLPVEKKCERPNKCKGQ